MHECLLDNKNKIAKYFSTKYNHVCEHVRVLNRVLYQNSLQNCSSICFKCRSRRKRCWLFHSVLQSNISIIFLGGCGKPIFIVSFRLLLINVVVKRISLSIQFQFLDLYLAIVQVNLLLFESN